MIVYILKRLLIFIPTLVVISLLAFVISLNSPTDPVERLVNVAVGESDLNSETNASEDLRQEVRHRLGLDLPVFYLKIAALSDCDTIYKIAERSVQNNLHTLTRRYGNWEAVESYYHNQVLFYNAVSSFEVDSILEKKYPHITLNKALNILSLSAKNLFEIAEESKVKETLAEIDTMLKKDCFSEFSPLFEQLDNSFNNLLTATSWWKSYIPKVQFYGRENQYHLWLFGNKERDRGGVIRGDFGKSFIDNKPIGQKIREMFPYSFFLVIVSIFLAYLISIPLGIYSAYKKDGLFDRVSSVLVFMLYSLPSFFVATWLLYQFSNPDNLLWFPSNGVKNPSTFNPDWAWYSIEKIKHQAPYFVLPIVSFVYSSFAFTSRIMRVSMVDVMEADYVRTARAKGLSEQQVVLKHALRNGLLPIITMFSNVFPAAIGGSVILETIFGIPGMGSAIFEAILGVDIPMIVAVFTLTGALTIAGYLVADVLYAFVDPRISYKKN